MGIGCLSVGSLDRRLQVRLNNCYLIPFKIKKKYDLMNNNSICRGEEK